jgi:hypothetical protein
VLTKTYQEEGENLLFVPLTVKYCTLNSTIIYFSKSQSTNRRENFTMAYMSQENKKSIGALLKPILKKYRVKASLSVHHHSGLTLTIQQSPIDFFGELTARNANTNGQNLDVNPYWYRDHFNGQSLQFLSEVIPVMNTGNWDKSEPQTDYFNVGWYIYVRIGKWDKPYQLVNEG